jgi:hypothetical protein
MPAKGKGSQDASLEFDVDWIIEHTRQVQGSCRGQMERLDLMGGSLVEHGRECNGFSASVSE